MIHPNPLAPVPTLAEMRAMVDKVGDPETWAQRLGAAEGHEATLHGAVARLLRLGVERWHWDEIPWSDIQRLFPTATPSTYWIVLHTETCDDRALYQRLAVHALGFYDHVWSIPFARAFAKATLLTVAKDMRMNYRNGCRRWTSTVVLRRHPKETPPVRAKGASRRKATARARAEAVLSFLIQ